MSRRSSYGKLPRTPTTKDEQDLTLSWYKIGKNNNISGYATSGEYVPLYLSVCLSVGVFVCVCVTT